MDISLREAQETIFNIIQGEEQRSLLSIKELCHCRFYDLPPVPEFHKPSVGMIRSDDLGRLVQFSGTVIRTGMVWLVAVHITCRSRCWRLRRNTSARIRVAVAGSKWKQILSKAESWRFLYESAPWVLLRRLAARLTKTPASANRCNSSQLKYVFSIVCDIRAASCAATTRRF